MIRNFKTIIKITESWPPCLRYKIRHVVAKDQSRENAYKKRERVNGVVRGRTDRSKVQINHQHSIRLRGYCNFHPTTIIERASERAINQTVPTDHHDDDGHGSKWVVQWIWKGMEK